MATVACCHLSHSLCQQSEQNRQCAVFSVCAFTCNKNTFRLNEFIFGCVRGMPVIDKRMEKLYVNPDRQGTGINCNINRGRAADCFCTEWLLLDRHPSSSDTNIYLSVL